ncbi:hypothetical protein C8R47DRAFT_607714 [Mycena vitilis]|nr:hypothetical protein C8R47DRAFT_607714 [Mycena vitilis]
MVCPCLSPPLYPLALHLLPASISLLHSTSPLPMATTAAISFLNELTSIPHDGVHHGVQCVHLSTEPPPSFPLALFSVASVLIILRSVLVFPDGRGPTRLTRRRRAKTAAMNPKWMHEWYVDVHALLSFSYDANIIHKIQAHPRGSLAAQSVHTRYLILPSPSPTPPLPPLASCLEFVADDFLRQDLCRECEEEDVEKQEDRIN